MTIETNYPADINEDDIVVELQLGHGDYDQLIRGAANAQVSPYEFLIGSIYLERQLEHERSLGNNILILTRQGSLKQMIW